MRSVRHTLITCSLALLPFATWATWASDDLPIQRIVLFKSGVGYFQHQGLVNANSQISIPFRTEQINDVLKSLVVNDPQGAIREVRYPSQDPLERSLAGFAIDLSAAQDLPSVLRQLRGSEVILRAPDRIQGRILSINTETQTIHLPNGNQNRLRHWLTIATEQGLQRLDLDGIASIQLTDPTLNEELQQALLLLAETQTNDSKNVTLRFGGQGQRQVGLGYIVEAPVWKTSWRLDLTGEDAYLQGWALVENTSDADWSNVQLALVSGQPVSFTMDLYTPLYAQRPEVAVPKPEQVTPKVFSGAIRKVPPPSPAAAEWRLTNQPEVISDRTYGSRDADMTIQLSNVGALATQATNRAIGELFQYDLKQPISLPRRTSAMLPIVDSTIMAEKVVIYNQQDQAQHPMNGVLMQNTSGAKLMAGPVTVFDEGYAGDAQIGHVPTDAQRLLAYSVNTDILAETESKTEQTTTSATIVDGVLQTQERRELKTTYRFNNESTTTRTLIIEHFKHPHQELVQPSEAFETTDTHYRFKTSVTPQQPTEFTVLTGQIISQSYGLLDVHLPTLLNYSQNQALSTPVRAALSQVSQQRQVLSQLQEQSRQVEQQLKQIENSQARLRENIKTVGAESSLGRRYLDKLSTQEDDIETLQTQGQNLDNQIRQARANLRQRVKALGDIQ